MEKTKKIKITIAGLGKLGQGTVEAALRAPDIEVVGAIEIKARDRTFDYPFSVTDRVARIKDEEIAILCLPTKQVTEVVPEFHKLGISTVDSFDMHQDANWKHYQEITKSVSEHKVRALTSGGTDPGFCSMARALFQIPAPWGITYTNYGPGTSMGHSCAVCAIPGVKDAISLTIPKGFGLTRRDVFIELAEGADEEQIRKTILADEYFSHDETIISFVPNVENLYDSGHRVQIERKGVAGRTHNQHFWFETFFTNSAITGQLLVACARALSKQPPGIYTMIDMPLKHFLTPLKEEELLFKEII